MNTYYDVNLKESRLKEITAVSEKSSGKWKFYKSSLENQTELKHIFNTHSPKIVINLAAQAGDEGYNGDVESVSEGVTTYL